MLSGKSTTLLARLKRAELAGKSVIAFKPSFDDRYSETEVVSHDGEKREAIVLKDHLDAIKVVLDEEPEVVGFDEAQFFASDLQLTARVIASLGTRVILAGLSSDFTGTPFPTMRELFGFADNVTNVFAVCNQCGADATKTQRVLDGVEVTTGETYLVGGQDCYEARCPSCFVWPSSTLESFENLTKVYSR